MSLKSVDSIKKPRWLEIAEQEIGQSEVPGKEANQKIVEYHSKTLLAATSDEVPWCSSFVNWCMDKAGYKGTNSAASRSWINWGIETEPKLGAIVILQRGDAKLKQGHVGFVVNLDPIFVHVLGGNQSNSVNVSRYFKWKVLAYRWPKIT
jgi:uncharacterized protein (TIGR02594 family)